MRKKSMLTKKTNHKKWKKVKKGIEKRKICLLTLCSASPGLVFAIGFAIFFRLNNPIK